MSDNFLKSKIKLEHKEISSQFVKQSRVSRKSKIEVKNSFHKKHPKSIEYYQSVAIPNHQLNDENIHHDINNEIQNKLSLDSLQNIINTNDKKSVTIVDNDNIYVKEQHFMPHKKENISDDISVIEHPINEQYISTIKSTMQTTHKNIDNNIKTTTTDKKSPHSNKESMKNLTGSHSKNHSSKHHSKKTPALLQTNHISSPKLKGNLQLMFQNLSKHYKKENLFLDSSLGYENIIVMKDFNVQTTIGTIKTNLSIRAVVGHYVDFKNVIIEHTTHFSPLKQHFSQWLQDSLNKFDAKTQLDDKLNSIFSLYQQDPRVAKFIPSLQGKLLQALKKPTKQNHGFMKKIEQIEHNWALEAKEIVHIEAIEEQLRFSSYEESFPLARSMKRKFSIFIGPTNSGKTYGALNELAQARSGVYLGPLRLMAHEGRESLFERGVIANLITGEERIEMLGATHVSSTVEMCNMSRMIDVAVIDEIQMIADESRGWAWSQALVGVPARHVMLVGSEEALPYILPVIKSLGEEYEIHRFERKTPLNMRDSLNKFKDLKANDCVVVFSRKNALEMKNAIESSGKKCSVIYGNLSPEVRRSEAAKFKSGENPILIATDAIGMGLNLPINRLFFSTMEKFDGEQTRLLHIGEIKQIAGRAGRYGFAEHGEVGILFDNSSEWRTLLHKAIYAGYEQAVDHRISIAPNLKQIQTICDTLGKQDLYSALIFFKEKMIRDHALYKTANLDSMIEIASLIKTKDLDLETGLNYACVPIDSGNDEHISHFFKWINNHIHTRENKCPVLPDVITDKKNDSYSLYEAENYVKLCMAYRWLHYKYPETYLDIDLVTEQAKTANTYIEHALHRHIVISKNPKWKR